MTKAIRAILFLLLFALAFSLLDQIFRWKDYYYATYPNTATVAGFYTMEKDSVDVIFLGSSQGTTAFDPQTLYDDYSLRSYNLSTEQQSIAVSYWLLKEALRTQSPQAVVLDVWMCFGNQNPLNSAESCVRKVIDQMRWSRVKREAIADICRTDPTLIKASFYLRNIRYHGRWKSLGEGDFSFAALSEPSQAKGFAPHSIPWKKGDFKPLDVPEGTEAEKMQANMERYLEKIVDMCEENRISLLLTKTPNRSWNARRHTAMQAFADSHELPFYDFNTVGIYEQAGYDYAKDGDGHVDCAGARKITATFGEILTFAYLLSPETDAQWEDSKAWAAHLYEAMELPHITDFREYLARLSKMLSENSGFTVLIACKDEGTAALDDSLRAALASLGVASDLKGKYRYSFYAVKGADGGQERLSKERISANGLLRGERSSYSISSAGFSCGNDCSIKIDRREYAKRKRGLNIVVYDSLYHRVADSVCFDTCSGLGCSR